MSHNQVIIDPPPTETTTTGLLRHKHELHFLICTNKCQILLILIYVKGFKG